MCCVYVFRQQQAAASIPNNQGAISPFIPLPLFFYLLPAAKRPLELTTCGTSAESMELAMIAPTANGPTSG